MIFNSLTFVAFFIIVMVLHGLPFSWETKKRNLLIASYVFYAAWNPAFVLLLWLSTVVDWFVARALYRATTPSGRRAWLLVSVSTSLCILVAFKYYDFLVDTSAWLLTLAGVAYRPPHLDIVLPIGISFYTFATMSYTLDIYHRRSEPASRFLDYALFVTFFPHLVAGPITRAPQLVPQFQKEHRASGDAIAYGLALIVAGLFLKVVIADGFLAATVDTVYDHHAIPATLDAWVATLAFSGQIFCDFSGYSTAAIGAALCLGFTLPENFRRPYGAIGFSDFWRRWHITLSTWLRDYLYIPLGGSRHGPWRTSGALLGTMLLGGLWHGANWTFVAWGALHGGYLVAERGLRRAFPSYRPGPVAMPVLAVGTFVLVSAAWAFFRATTMTRALAIVGAMGGVANGTRRILDNYALVTAVALVVVIVATHWAMRERSVDSILVRTPAWLIGIAVAAMAFAIVTVQDGGRSFLYFQF
ncbi:MBOAT family protein [Xanthomonas citri]|uniref:MBOAT family O-acyltransferase n=1 Tax=Xanthomonas citri TaxID=346 RepID=UPI0002D7B2B4|nr:MBOAT family O-acyltransferase [Xanthomonas citri]